jgi:hypothetical protein
MGRFFFDLQGRQDATDPTGLAFAIAQGAAARDRIPHQRMGVIAGAFVTEVKLSFSD